MPDAGFETRIAAVRRFNRFYTQRIGVLEHHYQNSPFSLAECRVLYELSQRDASTATDIAGELGLDNGYLSRILRRFEKDGLIGKEASAADGRQSVLVLSARGRKAYSRLEKETRARVGDMLAALPARAQSGVVTAMNTIVTTIGAAAGETQPALSVTLRPPQPGDFGWIVTRHAILYAQEYGWREPFEGLCAQIVADFANANDPRRERCWIAEHGGEKAGSIFLVKDSAPKTARIRLLLVEPSARGRGIGERLTQESIAFARTAGYRKITLWTHSILHGARHIYQRAGFKLMSTKPHKSWGKAVVGEIWDLQL